jgi:hypothetical protein
MNEINLYIASLSNRAFGSEQRRTRMNKVLVKLGSRYSGDFMEITRSMLTPAKLEVRINVTITTPHSVSGTTGARWFPSFYLSPTPRLSL